MADLASHAPALDPFTANIADSLEAAYAATTPETPHEMAGLDGVTACMYIIYALYSTQTSFHD